MDESNLKEIEESLRNVLCSDTNIISQATSKIKSFLSNEICIKPLFIILKNHPNSSIRLLSSVCLKKRLTTHWPKLQNLHTDIKISLLDLFDSEKVVKVQEHIGYIIGSLSSILLPTNEWPELFKSIQDYYIKDLEESKLKSLTLIFTVIESIGNLIEPYSSTIHSILMDSFEKKSQILVAKSVKILLSITQCNISQASLLTFQDLIPLSIHLALSFTDTEFLLEMIDSYSELVEIPDFMNKHIFGLLNSIRAIAENKTLAINLRQICLYFIESSCRSKPQILKSKPEEIIKCAELCFKIFAEEDPLITSYESEEMLISDSALDTIEQIAIHIPDKIICKPLLNLVYEYLGKEERYRRAALILLGVISGGLSDPFKSKLDEIMKIVLNAFNDNSLIIKEGCTLAICYLTENLQPEIIEKHNEILPILISFLSLKDDNLIIKLLSAIETFCENMLEEEIIHHLDSLLLGVCRFVNNPNIYIVRNALGALDSVCLIGKKIMHAYYAEIIGQLSQIILSRKDIECTSESLMAIGHILPYSPKEISDKYLPELTNLAFNEICKSDLVEMKEAAFSFFAELVVVQKESLVNLFDTLIKKVFEICKEDGTVKTYKEKEKEFIDSDNEEDEKNDANLEGFSVRTAFLDLKTSAVHLLGQLALHCPNLFSKYMEDSLNILDELWCHFHENVRYQCALTYQQLLESSVIQGGLSLPPKWEKGIPSKWVFPQNSHKFYYENILYKYLHSIKTESDMEVVSKIFDSFADLIKEFGPICIEFQKSKIIKIILQSLKRKINCLKNEKAKNENSDDEDMDDSSMEDDEDEEEDIDHEENLLISLIGVIQEVVFACGIDIEKDIILILNELLKYLKPPHPLSDSIVSIGCIAEIFRHVPKLIENYADKLLPPCISGCNDESSDMIRNSSFLIGVIAFENIQCCLPYIKQIFEVLKSTTQRSCSKEALDNIISTIIKIVSRLGKQSEISGFAQQAFALIPINSDVEENSEICKALSVIKSEDLDIMKGNERNILMTLAKAIIDPKVKANEETKKLSAKTYGRLISIDQFRIVHEELSSKMNLEEKKIIQTYFDL